MNDIPKKSLPIEFSRLLDLKRLNKEKSFFLFGPRGAGKSFLIRKTLKNDVLVINLLKTSLQLRLLQNPSQIEDLIDEAKSNSKISTIVIDEIQKIPALLDEVHRLIEEKNYRFLLTGSSERRLRSKGVNLLAGRAWTSELFPLTAREIPSFNLDRFLRYGGLPAVVLSAEPDEQLDAYVQSYLNEEIKSESVVRRILAFVEFLRLASLSNGQLINFAEFAKDAGVSPPTIARYYQILEDTLLGFQLNPWKKPRFRKAISTSKFYFFDTGVVNTLAGTMSVDRNSDTYGMLFEQWVAMELRAYLSYNRIKNKLYFWRTEDQIEVDFVVDGKFAIEVKSTKRISEKDLKGLKILQTENLVEKYYVVSHDPVDRKKDGIHLIHWRTFIARLAEAKL